MGGTCRDWSQEHERQLPEVSSGQPQGRGRLLTLWSAAEENTDPRQARTESTEVLHRHALSLARPTY